MTLKDTHNATSSPVLVAGVSRSDLPCGLTIDLFGQEAVPASHSAARLMEKIMGQAVKGIFGQFGKDSSWLAALRLSLGSRCQEAGHGWMNSAMEWKPWITPQGRVFFRLTVSRLTMSENDFILQATPTSTANQACESMKKHKGCIGIIVSPEEWGRRMGYSTEHLSSMRSAMQSFRKSRQSSSKQPKDKS